MKDKTADEQRNIFDRLHNEEGKTLATIASQLEISAQELQAIASAIAFEFKNPLVGTVGRQPKKRRKKQPGAMRDEIWSHLVMYGNQETMCAADGIALLGFVEQLVHMALGKIRLTEIQIEKI